MAIRKERGYLDTHDTPQSSAPVEAGMEAMGRGSLGGGTLRVRAQPASGRVARGHVRTCSSPVVVGGDPGESVRYLEQAYTAFRRHSDPAQAANAALEAPFPLPTRTSVTMPPPLDGWLAPHDWSTSSTSSLCEVGCCSSRRVVAPIPTRAKRGPVKRCS